jgi:hypothetical protein
MILAPSTAMVAALGNDLLKPHRLGACGCESHPREPAETEAAAPVIALPAIEQAPALMPEGATRNERPGSLRSAKSVCSEALIDSSQRVVNVGISYRPRFGTMADSMDPRCETL